MTIDMDTRFCEAMTHPGGSWYEQDGYCDEAASDDSDYCEAHAILAEGPDPDEGRDDDEPYWSDGSDNADWHLDGCWDE